MGQRGVEGEELSTVAEAIGRDIKNAHDERALTDGQNSIFDVPGSHLSTDYTDLRNLRNLWIDFRLGPDCRPLSVAESA